MKLIKSIPVLPSSDIKRDVLWYEKHLSFNFIGGNKMYAVIRRGNISLHLQWHAGIEEDPLLGGSVVRFQVEDLKELFDEFIEKGTVTSDKWVSKTTWETNEFGLYDLNKNALFFFEDLIS